MTATEYQVHTKVKEINDYCNVIDNILLSNPTGNITATERVRIISTGKALYSAKQDLDRLINDLPDYKVETISVSVQGRSLSLPFYYLFIAGIIDKVQVITNGQIIPNNQVLNANRPQVQQPIQPQSMTKDDYGGIGCLIAVIILVIIIVIATAH